MKKISNILVLLLFVMLSLSLFSQEVKYSDFSGDVKPKVGKYTSYVYKDGNTYKVGDRLKIGSTSMQGSNIFAYVREVIPFVSNEQINIAQSGSETTIKALYLGGNKKAGFSVAAVCTRSLRIELDQAIESGEIKLVGVLSSDEALSSLKKAKDKLDLGIITQMKYDSLKFELSKFIK
jgi:hypothetical protein